MKKLLLVLVSLICSFSANASLSTTDYMSNNYINEWTRLRMVHNQLSSEYGEAIQLKGWSTYPINFDEVDNCLSKDGFSAMKSWGANVVRLAINPKNSKGTYNETTSANIKSYIDILNELGMYVIVDWNVDNANDLVTYQKDAQSMFDDISSYVESKKYQNVIYEACGEPDGVSWDSIKDFVKTYVAPVLNKNCWDGAILIVATPQGDLNIAEAVNSPIDKTLYVNLDLMYAFHYNACSHEYLLGNFKSACASIPIFVSEWSAGKFGQSADSICEKFADELVYSCKPAHNSGEQLVSWCFSAWGEQNGDSNSLTDCSDGYSQTIFTNSGKYIVDILTMDDSTLEHRYNETINCSNCYDKEIIQSIPYSKDVIWGDLNVGWFDNKGEGESYHDKNSTRYKDAEHTIENPDGIEYKCCNAGAVKSGLDPVTSAFRANECVDVTQCAGLDGKYNVGDGYAHQGSDCYNLCNTESGEWINYTINVLKKGYYSIKVMTTTTTGTGTIGIFKWGKNGGNIIRNLNERETLDSRTSFKLKPMASCDYKDSKDWLCWEWNDVEDPQNEDENIGVVFTEEGLQTIQLRMSPDDPNGTPGDFSNILFTFVDCVEEVESCNCGVSHTIKDNNFSIYPNPTTGDFMVTLSEENEDAAISIANTQGQIVYQAAFTGAISINKKLAKGVYAVTVNTNNGRKTQKLVVK